MNRILIIEDDDILRKNIAFALEEAGYSAQMSANLTESEKMISDSDLILLDVILPDGNGMDFCRNIHEKYGTPIIFITSCDDEADVVNGLKIVATYDTNSEAANAVASGPAVVVNPYTSFALLIPDAVCTSEFGSQI